MLAVQAEQNEVLFSLRRRGSGRLALGLMLVVCGCASRPALSPSEAAHETAASDSADAPTGSAASAQMPAPQGPFAAQGQAITVANASSDPYAAPPLGLIEEVPPHYGQPTYDGGYMPMVPTGRVPATFVSHMQVAPPTDASPADALPAPAQVVPPPPNPEPIAAPPGQALNQPITQPASPPPTNDRWLRLPPASSGLENVEISTASDLVSLTARDAPLNSVLALIAEQHGLNVVTGADVTEQISVKITSARLEDALDAILATNGYTWARRSNIIIISKISGDKKSSPATQGRNVQVFTLDYMSATDADKVVQGLLSPVGQSFITTTDKADHRRTHEQLVVEDLPEYLHRIEQYLLQADTPPRQVQIEAHVL